MIEIYYKHHKSRRSEAEFFRSFLEYYPHAEVINTNYLVHAEKLDCLVDTEKLIQSLQLEQKLPVSKKAKCLEVLASCPSKLKVALKPNQISFDIVVVDDGKPTYWEYHERQHRNLSVDRAQSVYDAEGNPITAPRYLQRLVRDYWRIQNFEPFGVVWQDWFELNHGQFQPQLLSGFKEYNLQNRFHFTEFVANSTNF